MGIVATARSAFKAAVATFKAANNPTREQLRKFVAAISNVSNEWLVKFDGQEAQALSDFAAAKPAQFAAHLATVPDPEVADQDELSSPFQPPT